ncbi:hypothetical protein PG988_006117 [Apiospora saccharicola]
MQGRGAAPPSCEGSVTAQQFHTNFPVSHTDNTYAAPSRAEKQDLAGALLRSPFQQTGDDNSPPSSQSATTEYPRSSSVSLVSPVSTMSPPFTSTMQKQQYQPELGPMSPQQTLSPTVPSLAAEQQIRPISPLRMHPVFPDTPATAGPATQQLYDVPLLQRPVPPRQASGPAHLQRPIGLVDQGSTPSRPILTPSLTALDRTKTSSSGSSSLQQYASKLHSTAAMDKECVKARKILESFLGGDDAKPIPARSSKSTHVQIPDAVLQQAHGLVMYTVVRAGLNLSGSRGSGVVLARLPVHTIPTGGASADTASMSTNASSAFRRWSGPSAFSVYGAGASLIGGFDVSESVCVLNSAEAVSAFHDGTTSRGGAELGSYQRTVVRLGNKSNGGGAGPSP